MSSLEEDQIRKLYNQIEEYNSRLLSATDKEDRDFWGDKVDKARESLNVINASRQQPPQAGKD
jgi:hypothetical protein